MITLYHASNQEVKEPKIMNNLRNLDFGPGFYTTTSGEQAMRYSKRVASKRGGNPVINVYAFDEENARNCLKVREFHEPDSAWLDFVANNRMNTYAGEHSDLIIGPVANDDVFDTLKHYCQGKIGDKEALRKLRANRLYVQIAFASDEALAFLKFTRTL